MSSAMKYFGLGKGRPMMSIISRLWSQKNGQNSNCSESKLVEILKSNFPKATSINVKDISGGCGAMFELYVESEDFKGLTILKQHALVTDVLKNQIKEMHGVRINTSIPKTSSS